MSGDEAYRVFNMGIGMVIVIPSDLATAAIEAVPAAVVIGELFEQDGRPAVRLD